jgi:hypothetical protein
MTPHPCDGHACDHCYCCDVLRVCCGSVSAAERVRLEAEHRWLTADRLLIAVRQEAQTTVSLTQLVRQEVKDRRPEQLPMVRALPPAPVLPIAQEPEPRKEHHVRTHIVR